MSFPDTSEGEPTPSGPKHVDCEPFPQDIADEITRLREQERELAWTYDYIPTELDKSFHAIDQYGVRIQRTTRPPYISPDEWIKIKGAARDRILKDFDKGVKELKTLRARIRELEVRSMITMHVEVCVSYEIVVTFIPPRLPSKELVGVRLLWVTHSAVPGGH